MTVHNNQAENTKENACLLEKQQQRQTNVTGRLNLDALLDIEDINQLKSEMKSLYEVLSQQKTHIKNLEFSLEMEQGQVNILQHNNQTLRKRAVDMTVLNEQEEEFISNKLLKHINSLKKEKGELLVQVEQEEEHLTNMLQKKLIQLQKDKIDLENTLEQEQEYMVNQLQKQLDMFRQSSPSSSRGSDTTSLSSSPIFSAAIGNTSPYGTKKWVTESPIPPPLGVVDVLKSEIGALKCKLYEMDKEYNLKQHQCDKYRQELIQFRKEYDMDLNGLDADVKDDR
ncbi:hypothetical protein K501DRAFT_254166 [Backusella circina FSU 941]|nr:hypothetical protein K501DRAFT_254166 [Backusella circina FSU 941]